MGIDQNLLEQMSQDIESELAKKRLSSTSRRALQMDRLMIMFMRQSLVDRDRIKMLETTSWGYKVYNNPKLSLFLLSVYIVISAFVNVNDIIRIALGL